MNAPVAFDRVTVTYNGALAPTLREVSLRLDEGEFVVVVGGTGSGKSTLLRSICGLVPHFSGGTLLGSVTVEGRSTEQHRPRDLADIVGFVGQNPAAGFVTDRVEDELAFTMENLGVTPAAMRRRVEDVVDLLGLSDIRQRRLSTLSGGQQQRVAIASVLTASPRVLVLDEPTSSLDPAGCEEVLSALARLCHDVGLTIVVAEHRLERIIHLADRIVVISEDGAAQIDSPSQALKLTPLVPPIIELGRALGWAPLPTSVREARRLAAPLREQLRSAEPTSAEPTPMEPTRGMQRFELRGCTVDYSPTRALDNATITGTAGEILAVMGRNGSGKSTLLNLLAGVLRPSKGTVRVDDHDPHSLTGRERISRIGYVPQDPADLLYGSSVAEECRLADQESGLVDGTTLATLHHLGGTNAPRGEQHPRDVSEGQRLLLALAVVLAHEPSTVLLDEPTRGLDYSAKLQLREVLRRLANEGASVVIATHDTELVATLADRVVVLAGGEIIADGPARSVVCHTPSLSPQVARIMAPLELLTVGEVTEALSSEALS
jgi:energy-coupling factor transport system ATP-binding protein